MISRIKKRISQHLLNFQGWKTNRKLVVIESDDWGSIRMPSLEAYNELLRAGVPVNESPYCKYDSLASEEDLELLFDLLSGFKDSVGKYPIITANTVVSNPDFEKIRESGFRDYYCESIVETFKKYPKHLNCLKIWKKANQDDLFHPQSHGKEHLNTSLWMKLLQNNKDNFRRAFDYECWGLSNDVYPDMERSIQASFDAEDILELKNQEDVIRNGLRLFEEIFGYRSKSFIANNFIWSSNLNKILYEEGVKYLQGMKYQKLPLMNGDKRKMIRHYMGERNEIGQYYLIRNCTFEPSIDGKKSDHVSECLGGIYTAFLWKKPAIISSHRLNYVGFLNKKNRDHNLRDLKRLLDEIISRWPDVEFMTSDQLGSIIDAKVCNNTSP